MSFIQLAGINEVQELQIAPEGDYSLQITDAELQESKNTGRPMIRCRIEFEDYDEYSGFYHYLSLPSVKLDNPDGTEEGQKKLQTMMRGVKRFLHLWGIQATDDGFEISDFTGAQTMAHVVQEASKDKDGNETGDFNNRLVVPRVKDE